MKRFGGLWPQVVSFDNLMLAWRKARRGKRQRPDVARFTLNLEFELLALRRELMSGAYQPGAYRLFQIYESKPRTIARAPFRDRVVHHAVMNVIEPLIDRRFSHDSYACRTGKGVHAAVDRYQHWARRYPYCLKLDVAKYFPSINHELLIGKLHRCIKDRDVLQLLERIVRSSPDLLAGPLWYFKNDDLFSPALRRRGLPIGNLTSQFFGNLYLNDVDHWVRQNLHACAYLRYVDDFFLLSDSKGQLADWRAALSERLAEERLVFRNPTSPAMPTRYGVDVLGYRVFPGFRRLRAQNPRRYRRRLRQLGRAYYAGEVSVSDVTQSVARGSVMHGTRTLKACDVLLFQPLYSGEGDAPIDRRPCCSRRFVVQLSPWVAICQPRQGLPW